MLRDWWQSLEVRPLWRRSRQANTSRSTMSEWALWSVAGTRKQWHFRRGKNPDRKMHVPRTLRSRNYERNSMSVYEKVSSLGIALLSPPKSVGAFVPFVRNGNLLFLSGHIAKKDGQPWKGRLGADMTLAEGKAAARAAAIDVLGSLQSAAGDLNEISRIVKLLVLVNSSSTFTEHHL